MREALKRLTDSSYSYIVTSMNNKAHRNIDVFLDRCKAAHLRITPQRSIIYESLLSDKGHPSAEAVFNRVRKKIPSISFDTVNRTLLSFADIGLLKVVEGYGRPKRFDTDIEKHHHFRCLKCNKIIDFYNQGFDALEIPGVLKKKYVITGKKVVLEGVCDVCKG